MTEYRYALLNRPASLGAVPKDFIRVDPRPEPGTEHYETARHGIIVFDRRLNEDECYSYELPELIDGDTRLELARSIAGELRRYREALFDYEPEDRVSMLRMSVENKLNKRFRRTPSLGDFEAFVSSVIDAL